MAFAITVMRFVCLKNATKLNAGPLTEFSLFQNNGCAKAVYLSQLIRICIYIKILLTTDA